MPYNFSTQGRTMWTKRDELAGARPGGPEPIRHDAAVPQPTMAGAVSREPVPSSAAAIGTSMVIKGDIFSREELYVDGEVDGKLELQHRLTIGPRGKVRAQIRAREVVIAGTVEGNVEVSEKITIQRNGSLIGDIKTAGIVIDDGAYFKGSIDIVKSPPIKKPENVKVAQATQGAPAAQAAAQASRA
jgi:cytoskeletal protein CcmA (bactofilin family)